MATVFNGKEYGMKKTIQMVVLGVTLMFSACNPLSIPNIMTVTNGTSDTLVLDIPNAIASVRDTLAPDDMWICERYGNVFNFDTMRVYRDDSLMITWYPPRRHMDTAMHSFFNYYSWDMWGMYMEQFIITEADYGACF